MGQACFKTLSLLFKNHVHVFGDVSSEEGVGGSGVEEEKGGVKREGTGEGGKTKMNKRKKTSFFGLSPRQMRALLVVLQMAVAETEHQNATFGLIKAVVAKRIVMPEVHANSLSLGIGFDFDLRLFSGAMLVSFCPLFFILRFFAKSCRSVFIYLV